MWEPRRLRRSASELLPDLLWTLVATAWVALAATLAAGPPHARLAQAMPWSAMVRAPNSCKATADAGAFTAMHVGPLRDVTLAKASARATGQPRSCP